MRVMNSLNSRCTNDMTEGSVYKLLLAFSVPLLAGNSLQLLYNIVDVIIVGKYVSKEALAAVGSSGPLINMLIQFAVGLFNGASVLVARFFGSKDVKNLRNAIHTDILMSIILGVIITVVGLLLTPIILRMMSTPDEIMPKAVSYLRIYFSGILSLMVYNAGASILTALGDSRRPLYILLVSTAIHLTGDFIFVLVFHWGVAGVAASTVLAQCVSAILALIMLSQMNHSWKLRIQDLKIHFYILRQILHLGLPGGIQSSLIGFGNIFSQGYINGLGAIAMAGYASSQTVNLFVQLPMVIIGIAVSTFVAQNIGAGQVKRARKGVRVALVMGISSTFLFCWILLLTGRIIMKFISPDEAVINAAVQFIWVIMPFYFLMGGTNTLPSALRSAGRPLFPMFSNVFAIVVFRQVYLFFITKVNYSIITVGLGYPAAWLVGAILNSIYYYKSDWRHFEKKPDKSNTAVSEHMLTT